PAGRTTPAPVPRRRRRVAVRRGDRRQGRANAGCLRLRGCSAWVGSSMTHGTVGEMFVVDELMCEAPSLLGLIGGKLPIRIEYGGGRPQMRRGVAVAVEAPTHGQGFGLPHQRHGGDVAMAGAAADSFGDVD